MKDLSDEKKHIKKDLANFKKTEEELNYKIMKLENIKKPKKNREVISDKLTILHDKLENLGKANPKIN